MKILIVSDTHGRDANLETVVMQEAPFDLLIHCGDVEGKEFFIEALAEGPCCIVGGNNDFYSDLPSEEVVMLGKKRALVTHGHYYSVSRDYDYLVERAREKECEIALFGHIHRPVLEEYEGILLVNPGSLSFPRQKGRMPSYAVMRVDTLNEIHVDIQYLDD